MKHMDQGTSSLWFLPHGQCNEAVFDVKLKPRGEKGRKVIPCLWIHFLASALEPVARTHSAWEMCPSLLSSLSWLWLQTSTERWELGTSRRGQLLPWPCHLQHSQGQEPCYQNTQLLSKSHFWKWWTLLWWLHSKSFFAWLLESNFLVTCYIPGIIYILPQWTLMKAVSILTLFPLLLVLQMMSLSFRSGDRIWLQALL